MDDLRGSPRDGAPSFGHKVMKRASFHYTRITHHRPAYTNLIKRSSHHEEEKKFNTVMRQLTKRAEHRPSRFYSSPNGEGSLQEAISDSDSDDVTRCDESASWSGTMSKKAFKKLALTKQKVKRQESIFEFVQEEWNNLETLRILQKVYAKGLVRELGMDQTTINKLFPLIDQHVSYSAQLVQRLKERQNFSKIVSGIGDVLVDHFEASNGETMKRLFGDLCCKEAEILSFYKDMLKNDRKFYSFMKKCEKLPRVRRQDLPACLTAVTQRVGKLPSIVKSLLDHSDPSDNCEDHETLTKAFELTQDLVKDIQVQVRIRERKNLLLETHQNIEYKSYTKFKGRKFVRKDLLKRHRKLLYSANLQLSTQDYKKYIDVFVLVLSDCLVLLQEINNKFVFLSGQPAAVPLQKMIVREEAADYRGLYLISMSDECMYCLRHPTSQSCVEMAQTLRLAIAKCPEEDEGITSEEEDRKKRNRQMDKARQMVSQLEQSDRKIGKLLERKNDMFRNISDYARVRRAAALSMDAGDPDSDSEVGSRLDDFSPSNGSDRKVMRKLTLMKREVRRPEEDSLHFLLPPRSPSYSNASLSPARIAPNQPSLLKAVEQINKLTLAVYGAGRSPRLSFRPSDPGSQSRGNSIFLKRSDTFGGFDHAKLPIPKVRQFNSSHSDSTLNGIGQDKNGSRSLDSIPDESDTPTEEENAKEKPSPETPCEVEKDLVFCDSLPKSRAGVLTLDQVNALTRLSQALSEYQAFALQQDTYIEKLKLDVIQEDINIKKQAFGLQEAELKRNHIKQEELAENLKLQRKLLTTEQDEWITEMGKQQDQITFKRNECEREKNLILKEKEKLGREREELEKARSSLVWLRYSPGIISSDLQRTSS